jgi:hypothetical protein
VAEGAPAAAARCLNCGAALSGPYCATCGQRQTDLRVSFWHLITEALHEAFELDSRIVRTVVPFLFRPGQLAREYVAGRRTRYSSPLRIYLFCSFAYFLAASMGHHDRKVEVKTEAQEKEIKELRQEGHVAAFFADKLERLADLKASRPEDQRRFYAEVRNQLPKAFFLLLPLLALWLKLLYFRTDAFYVDHLILALHLQAFTFLAVLASDLWDPLVLLSAGYGLLSLKRFYGQPWPRTVAKACALLLLQLTATMVVYIFTFFFALRSGT